MLIKTFFFQINNDVAGPASVSSTAPCRYIPLLHQKDKNIKNKKAANKNTT